MRLKDKIAIVTGGSQGIGRAISELFAKEGATVIIMDLLPLFEHVNSKYGKIDILINNAGITRDRTLEKMTEDEFDAVIEVNLKGVFICTQAVAPYMKANKYGRIVSAASNVGYNLKCHSSRFYHDRYGLQNSARAF